MEDFDKMTEEEKKRFLQKLYNGENKTSQEIGDLIGKTKYSVKHFLEKYNIKKEAKQQTKQPEKPVKKVDDGLKDKLYLLYITENKTCQEIGELIGRTKDSVKSLLKKYKIRKNDVPKQPKPKQSVKKVTITTTPISVEDDTTFLLSDLNVKYDDIMDHLNIIIDKLDVLLEKKN